MPKTITHMQQLRDTKELVDSFLEECGALGSKLGCILVQFPPKLSFDAVVAGEFFSFLRARTPLPVACEPRHASWFEEDADRLMDTFHVARVAADPARVAAAVAPGGWRGFSYFRLHGSPKIYYSAYSLEFISSLAARVEEAQAPERDVWVIFDNTTLGAATRNALELSRALQV
jgi:uncharacterized protein YecE (DUF72 family)